jgi:hypothetical protein
MHVICLLVKNICQIGKDWSGRQDSNLRPLRPKRSALPLRYARITWTSRQDSNLRTYSFVASCSSFELRED